MTAYIYQAALLCSDCAAPLLASLPAAEDLDHYPQGPYGDGGGEADCPQHCDHCGTFLENPLTSDGLDYVRDAIAQNMATGRGNNEVLAEWSRFYDIRPDDNDGLDWHPVAEGRS